MAIGYFICHPRLAAKAPRVKALLCQWDCAVNHYDPLCMAYALQGLSSRRCGISPWRLALFNFIGAAIWAPVVAAVGFLAGHAVQELMLDIELAKIVGPYCFGLWWRDQPGSFTVRR